MLAWRLTGSVQPSDAVARPSGDEGQLIARKIVAAVEKPFVLDGELTGVTASIGIAMHTHARESPSAIMKRADEALYKPSARGAIRSTGALKRRSPLRSSYNAGERAAASVTQQVSLSCA